MRIIDDLINKATEVDTRTEETTIISLMQAMGVRELPPFTVEAVVPGARGRARFTYYIYLEPGCAEDYLHVRKMANVLYSPGVCVGASVLSVQKQPTVVGVRWDPVCFAGERKAVFDALLAKQESQIEVPVEKPN